MDKYYKDPRFLPELVAKQSSAAMCLCMWARAMVVYDAVAKGASSCTLQYAALNTLPLVHTLTTQRNTLITIPLTPNI